MTAPFDSRTPVAPQRLRRLLVILICVFCAVSTGRAQMHNGEELVKADLIADTTAILPGKPFTVGLRLTMAPHWHTYWQYSGDAGLPTKIDWQLPEGFKAGALQWPVPEKITSPGDIINYGYSDQVVLLATITPPANLAAGDVALKGKAEWLVCSDICVPGGANLELKLPAGGAEAQAANAGVFAKTRASLPVPVTPDSGVSITRKVEGSDLVLTVTGLHADWSELDFYPLPEDPAQVGHPEITAQAASGSAVIKLQIVSGAGDAAKVGGVIAVTAPGGKRMGFIVPDGLAASPASGKGLAAAGQASPSPASSITRLPNAPAGSLWHFLLLGFLGGLILNVMPCVLPVISLKLFSFIKQANEDPARVWRMGLAYAAGVFAWFLGFAALVVILKSVGREVGYAFHLQNPWFLVALSAVTFVFALNLLGVFEILLPGSVNNALGEAAVSREGYIGAFLQGVLATVLGSACTAPLFGEALGFAFSQSSAVIFVMFAAIAAGMSAPFVLLAARPGWLKFMPKPGAWMERVKQGTGFLMLATVLWLLWVLGQGRGADAVVWTGGLLLVLGAACWVQGAFNTLVASAGTRWISRAAIAILVLGGGWFAVQQIAQAEPPAARSTLPFAPQLDAALKSGRLVFVDFTADWCVNCKVNERVVLAAEPVQRALRDSNAVFLKADWTTGADDITKLLRQFGRAGVPLYVVYPAGKPDAPIVLPELLTQQLVLDAISDAAHRGAGARAVAQR